MRLNVTDLARRPHHSKFGMESVNPIDRGSDIGCGMALLALLLERGLYWAARRWLRAFPGS